MATLSGWNTRFGEKRLEDADLPVFGAREETSVKVVISAYADAFGVTKSGAEASRLIKQGSVQLDGKKIVDPTEKLSLRSGQVLRLDKTHAVRID